LETNLSLSLKESQASASCPEEWKIAAMIKGEVSNEDASALAAHIKECSCCMGRAAGFYKALQAEPIAINLPDAWKEAALHALADGVDQASNRESYFSRLVTNLKRIVSPIPAFPSYAVAAIAIIFLIIWNVMPQREIVRTVASNERISIRDSEIPSSLGFGGADETTGIKIMAIEIEGDSVVLNWKPIENSTGYDFTLKDKSDGNKVFSGSADSRATVLLNKTLLKKNIPYSWIITGRTSAGRYFEYTGEFTLLDKGR
jgi:hypothetical protein